MTTLHTAIKAITLLQVTSVRVKLVSLSINGVGIIPAYSIPLLINILL